MKFVILNTCFCVILLGCTPEKNSGVDANESNGHIISHFHKWEDSLALCFPVYAVKPGESLYRSHFMGIEILEIFLDKTPLTVNEQSTTFSGLDYSEITVDSNIYHYRFSSEELISVIDNDDPKKIEINTFSLPSSLQDISNILIKYRVNYPSGVTGEPNTLEMHAYP